MKNADTPAMPKGTAVSPKGNVYGIRESESGLTKREHFAAMAIQGWLARCANVPHHAQLDPEAMASVAVSMADALLKELEK